MSNREEIFYCLARALDHSREASESQEAVDLGHDTPENASRRHYDAAGLLEGVTVRLHALREQHVFAAKRMQREARREAASASYEYRAGNDAA